MATWEWREVGICETFLRHIINSKFIGCGYQEEQRVKEDSQVSGLEQLKAIFEVEISGERLEDKFQFELVEWMC